MPRNRKAGSQPGRFKTNQMNCGRNGGIASNDEIGRGPGGFVSRGITWRDELRAKSGVSESHVFGLQFGKQWTSAANKFFDRQAITFVVILARNVSRRWADEHTIPNSAR